MILRRLLLGFAMAVLLLAGCSGDDDKAFSQVDYNKDGKIIFEELIVAFPDLTVEEFLAADADHDGGLNPKEYERFREARRTGRKLTPPAEATPAPAPAAPVPSAPEGQAVPPAAAPAADAPVAASVPAPVPAPDQVPVPPAATVSTPEPAEAPATAPVGVPAPQSAVTAPTPAPANPGSYVVGRGDSLSRLAKRFGVTQQALMEANGLKNADRLEAGATLAIPVAGEPVGPAATVAVPPAVTAFVTDFFAKSSGADVNALLDLYADSVDYYGRGKSGRDIVRQDKARFFSRWPKRHYRPGAATVTAGPGDTLRVTVPVDFTASRDGAATSGRSVFTLVLRPEGQGYRIVGERSLVAKRDGPGR